MLSSDPHRPESCELLAKSSVERWTGELRAGIHRAKFLLRTPTLYRRSAEGPFGELTNEWEVTCNCTRENRRLLEFGPYAIEPTAVVEKGNRRRSISWLQCAQERTDKEFNMN